MARLFAPTGSRQERSSRPRLDWPASIWPPGLASDRSPIETPTSPEPRCTARRRFSMPGSTTRINIPLQLRVAQETPEHARQDHSQTSRAALLSAFNSGAEGAGRVIRQGCIRTGEDGLQRPGEVRNVPRAAALLGTRQQFACARRDRHRCIPSRPLANSHVPHVTVSRAMDASEGWLLP